jgi:hypothetical protein
VQIDSDSLRGLERGLRLVWRRTLEGRRKKDFQEISKGGFLNALGPLGYLKVPLSVCYHYGHRGQAVRETGIGGVYGASYLAAGKDVLLGSVTDVKN